MFFVTGLPRSRTTWFSAYLDCEHDLLGRVTRKAFYKIMPTLTGLSDSGLMFTDFQKKWDAPTLIIERDPLEVAESMERIGEPIPAALLSMGVAKLAEVQGLRVPIDEIDERLPEINDYLGLEYDPIRAERYKRMKITPLLQDSNVDVFKEWF